MVHIICCFQCPSAVVENGKSHLCFIACADLFFSLNLQGVILHKYILFSCCQWKQKILFKVSLRSVSVEVAIPKLLMIGKNTNIVFSRVVLSMWTNGSRMSFECIEKGFRDDC